MANLTQAQCQAIAAGDPQALIQALNAIAGMRQPQTTAVVAVTPGASPYIYTNSSQFVQQVTISGGTISIISLSRGGVTGENTGTYLLCPGDSVTVTYSVVPTVFNVANII